MRGPFWSITDPVDGERITLCNACAEEVLAHSLGEYAQLGVVSTDMAGMAAEMNAMCALLGSPDFITCTDLGRCDNPRHEGGGNDAA